MKKVIISMVLVLLLMPISVWPGTQKLQQTDSVTGAEQVSTSHLATEGGGKSMLNNYTNCKKDGDCEVSAEFVVLYDHTSCKKEAVEPIIIFAHDEDGRSVKADVYVDDNKIGTTPGSFYVPVCSFKLMLKAKNKYFYQRLDMHKRIETFINATLKPELQWSKKATKVKSPEQYCKNLNENGYNDWRLPTIDDFKTAVSCPSKLNGGNCEFLIKSYKSLKKSGSEEKFETKDEEMWVSSAQGAKISFLGENETFTAASSDCPISDNFVKISRGKDGSNGVYFDSVCSMDNSKKKEDSGNYDVRCVR